MVYVLAAYSITFGVLAIYGVLLQSRAQIARARVADGGAAASAASFRGFNLGATLLAPFWAWFHGLRALGLTLLATSVVLVFAGASGLRGAAVTLAGILATASIGLGVVANRVAAQRRPGEEPAAFFASQRRWALVGAVLYTVVAPWVWYLGLAGA